MNLLRGLDVRAWSKRVFIKASPVNHCDKEIKKRVLQSFGKSGILPLYGLFGNFSCFSAAVSGRLIGTVDRF